MSDSNCRVNIGLIKDSHFNWLCHTFVNRPNLQGFIGQQGLLHLTEHVLMPLGGGGGCLWMPLAPYANPFGN